MRSAFSKDFWRSISHSWGRFLAIAAIVALGAGFYAGLRMTAPDMELAADAYYDGTDLMDIRVFVDADADVRLARRVLRDTEKRGRTVRSVVEQWQNTVKPMHEKYVEPSKKNADIIVPQGGKNPVALDLIVGRIQRHLDENA